MSNNNLSPRQKMINMMYLVLIALLALNVSKDILKTFHLFEVSFTKANQNLNERNNDILTQFQIMFQNENEKYKVEKWYAKAQETEKISKEFNTYIEELKNQIIQNAGGRVKDEKGNSNLTEIAQPDNMEKHANFFITKGQGNGLKLLNKINETRTRMLNQLEGVKNYENVKKSIENSTQFTVDNKTDKSKEQWVNTYFENVPLAGVAAYLTKIQNDCKHLESSVLNVLHANINEFSIINTAQKAIIIPESKYVMSGQTFKAQIALATYDNRTEKEMIVNGQKINVKDGIGEYVAVASGNNTYKIRAKVESTDPKTGEKIFVETEPIEWNSFLPAATISADAMNVLFVGVENPLSISIPGVTPENTIVNTSSNIGLKKLGNGVYSVNPQVGSPNNVNISVSAKMPDGSIKNMGTKEYRIKRVPAPKIIYGNLKNGGKYPKTTIMAQQFIYATIEDFYFKNIAYKVISYKCVVVSKSRSSDDKTEKSNSTKPVHDLIRDSKSGDVVLIYNLKVSGPAGERAMDDVLSFTIQ